MIADKYLREELMMVAGRNAIAYIKSGEKAGELGRVGARVVMLVDTGLGMGRGLEWETRRQWRTRG